MFRSAKTGIGWKTKNRGHSLDVPRGLEDLFVLLGALRIVRGGRVRPATAFVDLEKHVRDVLREKMVSRRRTPGMPHTPRRWGTYVVISTENDEERARRGWDENEPVLCECVGVEQAAALLLVAHHVLLVLIRAVQWRQVEVRRRVVNRVVCRRRAEERVRHERRERERQGRVPARVGYPLRSFRNISSRRMT